MECSQHSVDELVNEVLTGSPGTAVGEGVSLLLEALGGAGELEGPEEVVGLLEFRSDGPDLVNEVLNAVDSAALSEGVGNDGVIGEGDSGSVNLTVSSLVDESLESGAGRVSVGDERLNHSDHVDSGSGHSYEDSVMELSETEELHDQNG